MAPTIMVEQLTRPRPEDGVAGTLAVTLTLPDGSVWRAVATDGVALPVVLSTIPWSGAQH
jgi:hypothetical protein